jgi:hypothetical protein
VVARDRVAADIGQPGGAVRDEGEDPRAGPERFDHRIGDRGCPPIAEELWPPRGRRGEGIGRDHRRPMIRRVATLSASAACAAAALWRAGPPRMIPA